MALVASVAMLGRPASVDGAAGARPVYKTYSVYLGETRPVLHQWWGALEGWRGSHFLLESLDSNTENATELQELLHQWWGALEGWRGSHFLLEPLASNTASTAQLQPLLNQWQNALESWRGSHFLLEPPGPYQSGFPTFTGTFKLTPKHAQVPTRDAVTYEVLWTVPRPNNWHDLKAIDLRVCGRGGVLWVRWEELGNTLSLLDPKTARPLASGTVGDRGRLNSPTATLSLADSSVSGNGETGRKVTLSLDLEFKPATEGTDCDIDLAAKDDLGNSDPFKRAGGLEIRP